MPTPKQVIEQGLVQLPPNAVERWENRQLVTMWHTVAKDLSIPEFEMFLTLAANYDLDPLLREIWAVKGRAKNGRPGKLMILVGRDGLLRNARRDPLWLGCDTDVVHEFDHFEIRRSKDGREIIHNWTTGAAAKDPSAEYNGRGKVIGAWAQVYQQGKHDTFFWAPIEEYRPTSPDSWSPWSKQLSVMAQKCALSLCLRLAFNLSGVVGEDEAARMLDDEPASGVADDEASLSALADLVPEDYRDRFYAAYGEACDVRPGEETVAALQMRLAGQEPSFVARYVEQMEEANETARARGAISDADVVVEGDESLGGGDDGLADEDPLGSGEELPAAETSEAIAAEEAGEDSPAPAAQELEIDVEALRRRFGQLQGRRTDDRLSPAEAEIVDEELAFIEGELRKAGADVPGQESLL